MNYINLMESIADWMAAANSNGNLLLAPNGVQSQALALTTSSDHPNQNNASSAGKTIPIRCIVESVPHIPRFSYDINPNSQTEVDRRANVPTLTRFHNLLEAVLQIFGYPKETATTAKGFIILNCWRPIPVEKVAIDGNKTVYDVLSQINSFVTLRIEILRTVSCPNKSFVLLKDKLLQILLFKNFNTILNTGCPLDQVTLKNILSGTDYGSTVPTDEIFRKFELWVSSQLSQARPTPYPVSSQFSHLLGSPTLIPQDGEFVGSHLEGCVHHKQPVKSIYPAQKTRVRTSFDPELELPKLQKWFAGNQHPDRQQIRKYVEELNSLESRKDRKHLDINNVVYWFKNARAAQKRAETRAIIAGNLNSMNDYHSDDSPCDRPTSALTSKESLASAESCVEDFEDEDNRSDEDVELNSVNVRPSDNSPDVPLWLTKNNNRNSPLVKKEEGVPSDEVVKQNSLLTLKQEAEYSRLETEDEDTDENDIEMGNDCFVKRNSNPLMTPRPLNNNNSLFSRPVPDYNFSMTRMLNTFPNNVPINMGHPICHSTPADDKPGKRNRTFIDPVSEVPCLENWFSNNTHPSQSLIQEYTDILNGMPYRRKFPHLTNQNITFWFKNRRAKCKRLRTSIYENVALNKNLSSNRL